MTWPKRRGRPVTTGGLVLFAVGGCALSAPPAPAPRVLVGAEWRAEAPVGHRAEAIRRNLAPRDTLRFGALRVQVLESGPAPDPAPYPAAEAPQPQPEPASAPAPAATLAVTHDGRETELTVAAGAAASWAGHRIAVLAVRGEGELGGGLVELEVATLASLPVQVAVSELAGGADMRLRVAHAITHITLHHTGSREPLRPGDDPVQRLRGLQSWGRSDRNWWDVPYHFLIDLDGRIYEGRDWRYMGETNTAYDPRGHLLISVIGNYGLQEANRAQLVAITALMAWAVDRFDVPLERIGGHYDHAATSCPGTHLRKYLEDGTFRRGVEAALRAREREGARRRRT